jgi:hypothetical protein
MTDAGPVIVYRDRSPDEIRDISIARLVEGEWTSPVSVHHDGWEIPGCPVNGPAIDAIGSDVVVAWFTAAKGDPVVRLAHSSDNGKTFFNPITIDAHADDGTSDDGPLGRVSLRMIGNANAAVVGWVDTDSTPADASEDYSKGGAAFRLRLVTLKDGDTLHHPVTITALDDSRSSGVPQMAWLRDSLILSWTDTTGSGGVRCAALPVGILK